MFIKFVDIDWFLCVILTLLRYLRACHMWLTRNHMFISESWGTFTSFIFWNFEISILNSKFPKSELGKFIPNFLNMWLCHRCVIYSSFFPRWNGWKLFHPWDVNYCDVINVNHVFFLDLGQSRISCQYYVREIRILLIFYRLMIYLISLMI